MPFTKKLFLIYFLLFSISLCANETKQKDTDFGSLSGLIRFYYVFGPSYVKSGRANDYDIDGSAIGGHLRYTSPTFSNFGASAALYYVQDTGLNDKNDPDTIMAAGRFFTRDYSPQATLGEINLFYKNKKHHLVLGRQKINSPLTNAIYTYMPHMFEAAYYENTQIEDTKLVFLQIDKMAFGTRAPVEFGLIGETTRTGGTTQNGLDIRGKFLPIEQQILANKTANTKGITGLAFVNNSLENITIRAWDFYAHDIINMFYFDVKYKNKSNDLSYSAAAQYLNVHAVGKNLASTWLDADYASLYGLKVDLNYKKVYAYIGYNHSGNAKLFNPWGGDPAYTSSFFSKNAYRANVDAYKIGVNVALTKKLKLITSHADYGQSTTVGTFAPARPFQAPALPRGDAIESALLFSYNPIQSLNILTGVIYKTSEYFYADKQVKLLDLDLLITYKF